jgi:hypothetical protein
LHCQIAKTRPHFWRLVEVQVLDLREFQGHGAQPSGLHLVIASPLLCCLLLFPPFHHDHPWLEEPQNFE